MSFRPHAISVGFGAALIGAIRAYTARNHLYHYQWDIEKLPPRGVVFAERVERPVAKVGDGSWSWQ